MNWTAMSLGALMLAAAAAPLADGPRADRATPAGPSAGAVASNSACDPHTEPWLPGTLVFPDDGYDGAVSIGEGNELPHRAVMECVTV